MDQIRPEIVLGALAAVLIVVLLIGRAFSRKPAPAARPITAATTTPQPPVAAQAPKRAESPPPVQQQPAQSYAAIAATEPPRARSYAEVAAAYASANPRPAPSPVASPRIDYTRDAAAIAGSTSYTAVAVSAASRSG